MATRSASPTGSELIGIVVGLAAEARLAAGLGCVVEIGGGTPAGAEAAVARLIARGVTGVVSFGLAGGLDPALRPGMLVVPEAVVVADAVPEGGVPEGGVPEGGVPEGGVPEGSVPEGTARPPSPVSWPGLARPSTTHEAASREVMDGRPSPAMTHRSGPSPAMRHRSGPSPAMTQRAVPLPARPVALEASAILSRALGGPTPHLLLAHTTVVATVAAKRELHARTGTHAVDLESGAVARAAAAAGIPFAVLRAVCDPAERDLPPAALAALDQRGAIGLLRVIGSVLARPTQLPGLLALARDAAAARRALLARVRQIGQLSIST